MCVSVSSSELWQVGVCLPRWEWAGINDLDGLEGRVFASRRQISLGAENYLSAERFRDFYTL